MKPTILCNKVHHFLNLLSSSIKISTNRIHITNINRLLLYPSNMENICFRDQSFLNSSPLSEHNILDYFSNSQFYDPSSTNEIYKMQTKYNTTTEHNIIENLKGLQFIINYFDDSRSLFIIFKIMRYGINDYEVLNVYYVMFGNIYMAPNNYSILNGRMANYYYYINEILDKYEEGVRFDVFKGFYVANEGGQHEVIRNEQKDEKYFFYDVLNDYLKSKND